MLACVISGAAAGGGIGFYLGSQQSPSAAIGGLVVGMITGAVTGTFAWIANIW